MENSRLLPGTRAFVMGLARSGAAVARLLLAHGVTVVVNERRDRQADEPEAVELERLGATVVFGGHPLSLLEPRPDFIVKNPGIPYSVPLLVKAAEQGIPIYTEIEIASWLTEAPIYAITGSNGKTTTTTLIGEILEHAGKEPVIAGNIGRVLSGVVEQVNPHQPIVLEVSSFQLLGTEHFHPKIAVLLNLYAAHLDYHGTMEDYAEAKWRLFRNLTSQDLAVLNFDQEMIRSRAEHLTSRVAWFSTKTEVPEGAFVRDATLVVRHNGEEFPLISVASLAQKGEHNLENSLAAAITALNAGASREDVAHVLGTFRGVEHRLEWVRTLNGVDFYNDSKATNAQAALRALRSFAGNIVWLAGGLDRGDDFHELDDDVRTRVKAAVVLGQSAKKVMEMCERAGVGQIVRAANLNEAVSMAHRLAEPGDVVLLSPACASWDMFQSFEERGSMFKHLVHTL